MLFDLLGHLVNSLLQLLGVRSLLPLLLRRSFGFPRGFLQLLGQLLDSAIFPCCIRFQVLCLLQIGGDLDLQLLNLLCVFFFAGFCELCVDRRSVSNFLLQLEDVLFLLTHLLFQLCNLLLRLMRRCLGLLLFDGLSVWSGTVLLLEEALSLEVFYLALHAPNRGISVSKLRAQNLDQFGIGSLVPVDGRETVSRERIGSERCLLEHQVLVGVATHARHAHLPDPADEGRPRLQQRQLFLLR